MGPPAANSKILYRNSRLLRMIFLQLHRQQRADLFCDVVLQAEGNFYRNTRDQNNVLMDIRAGKPQVYDHLSA